jgi:hypothetical protein
VVFSAGSATEVTGVQFKRALNERRWWAGMKWVGGQLVWL